MDFIQKYAEISLARASYIKQIEHLWKGDLMELAVRLGETASVSALRDIRRVLDDEKLDDPACFRKIEEIVNRYERLGPGAGSRHDFSLPFQIGVAGSRFAKPFVKISKSGSRLLMDDCPTNWNLPFSFNNSSADQNGGKDNGEKQGRNPDWT